MMLPSHLLATLLLGLLLARRRPFEARDWLLAIGFGVLIDLDHVLQLPRYVMLHGPASLLHPVEMMRWGSQWQGFMHGPWALLLVAPAVLLFRSPWPLVFWGLHMVQDFVVARHHVRFGGAAEWAIVALLAALVLLALELGRAQGEPMLRHAARTFGLGFVPRAPGAAPAAEALEAAAR